MKNIFKQNLFTWLTRFVIIIMPFYVFIKVFFEYKLGISYFWFFIKELVIFLLIFSLVYEFIKEKKFPKFDIIDYLIFCYIWYWIIITFVNWLWLNSVIYWWRYDFLFFIIFLIYKHWRRFLDIKVKKLILIFIYSGISALFLSVFIKFRIWEDTLLLFWFTDYISNWTYNWSIPTYHWLENSWMKRFQWIFDWPNAMWFFLILFTYLFLYLQKKKNEFYVFFVIIILSLLLFSTFSRSAILWIIWSTFILILLNFKYIYKNFKKELVAWVIVLFLISSVSWFIFQDKIKNIVLRTWSTTWHFDRMKIWIWRFIEKPFWSWLAESGPGYRNIYKNKQTKADEQYYIPESWFVQQLTEWWIIYFILFVTIFYFILRRLYNVSKIAFWLILSILIMNIFLHIFEATYLSILLFIFIWLFVSKD